jgi:hypothetical protein
MLNPRVLDPGHVQTNLYPTSIFRKKNISITIVNPKNQTVKSYVFKDSDVETFLALLLPISGACNLKISDFQPFHYGPLAITSTKSSHLWNV